jgi:hypothetical protein
MKGSANSFFYHVVTSLRFVASRDDEAGSSLWSAPSTGTSRMFVLV